MNDRHDAGHVGRIEAREMMHALLGSSLAAVLSLAAAWLIPDSGAASGLPGYMYVLLTVVYWVMGRWSRKAMARPV